jgi:hypothetical protein
MARRRFVARIVHRSEKSWAAAVANLVEWHAAAKDEAAEWPGRTAQESAISAAGGSDADGDDSGSDDSNTGDTDTGDGAESKPSGTAG